MKKIAEEIKTSEEQKYQFFADHCNKGHKVVDTGTLLIAFDVREKTDEEIRKEAFAKNFFNTSLGYVSRVVHFADHTENFLSDILPILEEGAKIITYNVDGTQNKNVVVTQQFLQECKEQKLKDFYGV